jgi:hypothetical protein
MREVENLRTTIENDYSEINGKYIQLENKNKEIADGL